MSRLDRFDLQGGASDINLQGNTKVRIYLCEVLFDDGDRGDYAYDGDEITYASCLTINYWGFK